MKKWNVKWYFQEDVCVCINQISTGTFQCCWTWAKMVFSCSELDEEKTLQDFTINILSISGEQMLACKHVKLVCFNHRNQGLVLGQLIYPQKGPSLDDSTFQRFSKEIFYIACSAEHFWLVKYLQHFISPAMFISLQLQAHCLYFCGTSRLFLFHQTSRWSDRQKHMTDGPTARLRLCLTFVQKMISWWV